MQKLAEENPDEAGAIVLVDRADEAEDELWHGLYWRAFAALQFDRQYGSMGGESPIPYSAISRYADDNGIPRDEFETFRRLLTAIDDEWLKHVAEKSRVKSTAA